jgi:hypothetical protein
MPGVEGVERQDHDERQAGVGFADSSVKVPFKPKAGLNGAPRNLRGCPILLAFFAREPALSGVEGVGILTFRINVSTLSLQRMQGQRWATCECCYTLLLQLLVLGFGLFKDGNIGVGVFPEVEEVFIRGKRTDTGGIGICALGIF